MAGPDTSPPTADRPLDNASMALIGGLALVLVAGFVVLSALGRDTTSYALFLGGPAVTGVVGAILTRRVKHVAAAVDGAHDQTKTLVQEQVSGLDDHLAEQDVAIGRVQAGVDTTRRQLSIGAQAVPLPRRSDSESELDRNVRDHPAGRGRPGG